MHAALPEVPEEHDAQAVTVDQRLELAQEFSEALGRDGAILPRWPGVELVRDAGRADGSFAHRPDVLLVPGVLDHRDVRRVLLLLELGLEPLGLLVGLLLRPAAELGEEPSPALGEELELLELLALVSEVARHVLVDRLERVRAVLADLHDVVGGLEDVGVPEHRRRPLGGVLDQAQRRLQRDRTGAFGAHERAGDVEAVLGQELLQVEARHPPLQRRIALAHRLAVAVAQVTELRVDLSLAPAAFDDPLELLLACRPDAHPRAVVEQDVELLDEVRGLAGRRHHRVGAAGVVADRAAQRRPRVGGRVGGEGEPPLHDGIAQVVVDEAGLHPRPAALDVDLDQLVHVLREVEHHRHVARLPAQARAAAPSQDRRAVPATDRDRGGHVVGVARDDHADGDLPVDRVVGGVEPAGRSVEAHLAAHDLRQGRLEHDGVDLSRRMLRRLATPRGGRELLDGQRKLHGDSFSERLGADVPPRPAASSM